MLEDRDRDVGAPGQVNQGAQVLRQARAAEGEARAQVGRADVELGVGAGRCPSPRASRARARGRWRRSRWRSRPSGRGSALSMYLVISATLTGTRKTGPGEPAVEPDQTARRSPSSSWPITVLGGSRKSRTLLPSRRNSGLTHTPKSRPARLPEARSRIGTSRSSQVPGSIVLRKTTVCRARLPAIAAPISSATRSRYVSREAAVGRRRRPDAHQREVARADALLRARGHAQARPSPPPRAMSSPMRSSTTGAWPRRSMSTLSALTSTPMTSLPRSARHAAETQPT